MEKQVEQGKRNTYITLTGEETAVKFDRKFRIFTIKNEGSSTVYASLDSNIKIGADGVYKVKSGDTVNIAFVRDTETVYVTGSSDDIMICAGNIPVNIYNNANGSGGSGDIIASDDAELVGPDDIDEMFSIENKESGTSE